jgi:hypothetical protein
MAQLAGSELGQLLFGVPVPFPEQIEVSSSGS